MKLKEWIQTIFQKNKIEGAFMGIIAKFVKNSQYTEDEVINNVNLAIRKGSRRDVKNRMKYIRKVEKKVKSLIPPEYLDELLPELPEFTKICVMTGAAKEMELKSATFDCKKCGECCRESSPIILNQNEVDGIISTYGNQERDNIVKAHADDIRDSLSPEDKEKLAQGYHLWVDSFKFRQVRPCKYLDSKTNLCRIYKSRPLNCSTFPIVPENSIKDEKYSLILHYFCQGEFEYHVRKVLTLLIDFTNPQLREIFD
jgi:Fe-S-cluster containining protein